MGILLDRVVERVVLPCIRSYSRENGKKGEGKDYDLKIVMETLVSATGLAYIFVLP